MDAVAVIGAYLLGAVPFSQIVSMRVAGTDLRAVGTGTVSGTGLYRIAGLWPLILGGGLDVVKGDWSRRRAWRHSSATCFWWSC
jgi:acyl phosphate:glycerol-3-phosphate acyltransferase